MIKLATDENFNGKIIRGIWRRNPDIDIVRVQDSPVFEGDVLLLAACSIEGEWEGQIHYLPL
ncbi:MAG: hypothetical protein CL608_22575 [Anaerolineaceae bacterium]|nr:hypothetical protein [Anaerolineaceae bacterium]